MINIIKEFLEEADSNSANLFFIERSKNNATKELSYKVVRTEIDPIIGKNLVEAASEQISAILSCGSECVEYGISPYYDKKVIEFLRCEEVPYLSKLILETGNDKKLEKFNKNATKKIFGYIVRIINNDSNKTLYLFRKYSPKKLLEPSKIPVWLKGDCEFIHLNEDIVALDKIYDAALISSAEEDLTDLNVFIFCQSYFELLFSFIEHYEKEIDDKKKILEERGILKDSNELISLCKNDSRLIKKFARILKNGDLNNMKIEMIIDTIRQFNLEIDLENNKLVADKDNVWTILRILNDDYLKSQVTDSMYETHAKVKKQIN